MFTKLWEWLKSPILKVEKMSDDVVNVINPYPALMQNMTNSPVPLVPVADPDAIRDAVLVQVKKLLDLYGHDIPAWNEIVALAKKV